ncbi:MAG: hypothetical protein Q8R63_03410, partial [Ramlibacter sp.]|nr:hypothetical protein [Ramlibacter sp.]
MTSNEPSTRSSTRARAILWLVAAILCAVAPVALLVSLKAFDEAERNRAALEASLSRSAQSLAQSVDSELTSSLQALKVLSQSGFFQRDRVGSLGRLLHGRPRSDWDSLVVIDSAGTVVVDTAPARVAAADVGRLKALHARMLGTRAPLVTRAIGAGSPGLAAPTGQVMLAVPVMGEKQVRYVLGARISEATWVFLAAAAERPDGARVHIIDEHGEPILGPRADQPNGAPGAAYSAAHKIATAGWTAQITLEAEPVDERSRALLAER